VISPRIAGRAAPVAEGIFPGRRCQVSYAIFRAAARFAARIEKANRIVAAELFPACCLRGARSKEWLAQSGADHRLDRCAARPGLSSAVESFAKELLHQLIDHHISRAGIERHYLQGAGLRRQGSQIPDAS
jgi:hypothetical protein